MFAYANVYLKTTCECICEISIHRSEVHCGSAFEPGSSGLFYYCTAPVCVPAVLGALAVRWLSKKAFEKKTSPNTSKQKIKSRPGCVMSIHVACLWMCVLVSFSFERRVFIENWWWVSQGCGLFFSFTMANPGSSLCFNTHWSAPPVSTLDRSGGPRKMS